jgi:hypothetical protein
MDLKHANVSNMTPYFICWHSMTILSSASIIMEVFPTSHTNNIKEGIIHVVAHCIINILNPLACSINISRYVQTLHIFVNMIWVCKINEYYKICNVDE